MKQLLWSQQNYVGGGGEKKGLTSKATTRAWSRKSTKVSHDVIDAAEECP